MELVMDAMLSVFEEIGAELVSVIIKIIPIVAPVLCAILVVKIGIKVFKLLTGEEEYDFSDVDMPSWMEEEYDSWDDYFEDH